MKVSVLLPAYNHAAYVGEAIESVLNQSFADFELLIGDDGSPDNTADIISMYKDSRIRFFPHSKNYGASFNHGFLLRQAKGEYIALINSDDLWLPDKLKKQVDYLDNNPDVVLCSGNAKLIDENGNELEFIDNVFAQPNRTQLEWIQYFFEHGNCICHPSVLIRREIYEKLNYYNLAMRQLPDFDMWTRMIREGNFYIFQEPLVAHRRFIRSGVNTSSPTIENSIRDVMESYYISTHYLKDLSDELFSQSFRQLFRNPSASTEVELKCERFFLLAGNGRSHYYMDKIYVQAAIMYFLDNYDWEMAKVLREKYNYTVRDFYALSCRVDLLGLRGACPVSPEPVKDQSAPVIDNFNHEAFVSYVRNNRLKVFGLLLFKPKSRIYQLFAKLYRRFKK